jgi:hypothetical protein
MIDWNTVLIVGMVCATVITCIALLCRALTKERTA